MTINSQNKIRTFSGFQLNKEAQTVLHKTLLPAREQVQGFRWTPPEQWHLTTQFYGDLPWELALQLAEALMVLPLPKLPVRLQNIGVFPSLDKPCVLWVGVHSIGGNLSTIIEQIHAVGRSMKLETENRPYQLHITIGRRMVASKPTVSLPPLWNDSTLCETTLGPLTLFRSHRITAGPLYTPIRPSKSTK